MSEQDSARDAIFGLCLVLAAGVSWLIFFLYMLIMLLLKVLS